MSCSVEVILIPDSRERREALFVEGLSVSYTRSRCHYPRMANLSMSRPAMKRTLYISG